MILRRFTKHVSDQNWFAVGLDVLVVITGIFLGMQVTEWNDERKERQEEKLYIERLLFDAETSLAGIESVLKTQEKAIENIRWAVELLEGHGLTEGNMGAFGDVYLASFGWRQAVYHTDTIEELVSSGNLKILRSQTLRSQIARFRIELDLYEKRAAVVGSSMMANHSAISYFLKVDARHSRILSPPSALNGDDALYNHLNNISGGWEALHRFSNLFYQKSVAFRDELKREVEESN